DIGGGAFGVAGGLTLNNYRSVLAGGIDFQGFYINSIAISIGAALVVTAITFPAAFGIVRLGLGGLSLLRIATSIRILPVIFFVIPFYILFSNAGILDTIAVLIIANTFLHLP